MNAGIDCVFLQPGVSSLRPRAARSLLLLTALLLHTSSGSISAAGPGPIPQWIWRSEFPTNGEVVRFLRDFQVTGTPRGAELRGLADNRMVVSLNGTEVGEVRESGRFTRFDVLKLLRPGRNELRVRAFNTTGAAGILLRLEWEDADGSRQTLVSDPLWETSADEEGAVAGEVHSFGLSGVQPWGDPIEESDDYHQWRQALRSVEATDPSRLAVLPGFQVELLRSARADEGSWISLAFDPRGRLTIAREDKGLLRMTLPAERGGEMQVETIEDTLLECRGLLFAHGSLFVNANNSKGLYRLRDTNGDGRFDAQSDELRLLKQTGGGVGHGRNDLALGPDQRIYAIHGNNVLLPDDFQSLASPLRNLGEDRLVPTPWDQSLFDTGVKAPVGHVIRTNDDGATWELLAGGFRNPYGLDFNPQGELFTYDADMEWDPGAPWYRTTRVNHVVSGGEYGWRQGTAVWPPWFADSLPGVIDIGKGSPTGVKFGTGSQFPERFQQALFILDWAYGRIYAVHLIPRGASYVAQADLFLTGRPLNVTDLEIGPDGAMYFVTGGRRTQSGLYRVRWVGEAGVRDQGPGASDKGRDVRALRQRLEALHGGVDAKTVETAWPFLDHTDRWIRTAARVAIEHQPFAEWSERALGEKRPRAAAEALVALARCAAPAIQPELLNRLAQVSLGDLPPETQSAVLRACALTLHRLGPASPKAEARLVAWLEPDYPATTFAVNQQLGELLVTLGSPRAVEKTLALLQRTETQEEQLGYLMLLRNIRNGWTLEQRRAYFDKLVEANGFHGAQSVPIALRFIKTEAQATLSEAEREQFAPLLAALDPPPIPETAGEPRPFVKEWTAADIPELLEASPPAADFERGQALFGAGLCIRCHRLGIQGSPLGPDLTGVAGRFSRRDILESILNPSKVIDEKYKAVSIETTAGLVVTGRLVGGDPLSLTLAPDPLAPEKQQKILKSDIESQQDSPISPMPVGLLNTLSREEILQLLAFLEAAGNPRHPLYARSAE